MNQLAKFVILNILFLSSILNLSATGPSWIRSEINPISVNDKGEILCRTAFFANHSGGHFAPPFEYGLCIISKDTMIQITSRQLESPDYMSDSDESDYDNYKEYSKKMEALYTSPFDLKEFNTKELEFIKGYNFKFSNVKKYKKEKEYTFKDLKSKQGNSKTLTIKAILGGNGYYEKEVDKVVVLYDFGNILILQNIEKEYEDICDDALSFDYPIGYTYEWTDENGVTTSIDSGFECQTVTGVLFLK